MSINGVRGQSNPWIGQQFAQPLKFRFSRFEGPQTGLNPNKGGERTDGIEKTMVGSIPYIVATPSLRSSAAEPVLLAVARGERESVGRCIDQYAPLIWAMARRMSVTAADAEDAVQEIFMDLWRYAKRFDPAVGSEKVFVSVIARRRLIDRARHMQRQLAVERPLDASHISHLTSSFAVEQDVEIAEARRILEQLPPPHQEAITLSLLDGLSHGEIALRLGWPLGTVKTVIRRGILRLKESMSIRRRLSKEHEP